MSASQEARKELSKAIKEKIQNSKSVVFVSSVGLTVAEDTELRNEIRKNDVEYRVYKNTLIRYALHDLGITAFDADLNGPTSVAFGNDEVGAAKLMVEASKKYADKITVKSGYISEEYCDANSVKKYASIPSKNELYSMLAGTLSNFTRGLAVAIKAVADKKAEAQA
jgi:large subunit ribosomal protein L10